MSTTEQRMTPMPERFDPSDPTMVETGRRFPYSTVGDWVALSEVSHLATRVYWLLRMHCNRARGDERAWPSQRTLAALARTKKADTVGQAIRELTELGAVEVTVVRTPTGRRNIYTVHESPPEGYSGPVRHGEISAGQGT
ncbi:helix-turn-helix domain-containing protein [Actinomycetospora aeridis]|uniref:Helix-turn-helix domain-containing protein n=1 Tax=Actinomycetospora aeridis TaxID=3129231 RepID=A0ABU8N363_9PSEU